MPRSTRVRHEPTEDWHLVLQLPEYAPRRRQTAAAVQMPLPSPEAASTG
jgi:hypothetical protein